MGKLIAVDGVDASGKQTHTELLEKYFKDKGCLVRRLSFPRYESPSSEPVKMYLSGKFGENAGDVDAYAASCLFAVDRFATFRADWKKDYDNPDTIIIADRYVSSNMIHQASKIEALEEKDRFLNWLDDFEFGILSLPRPDITVFLDMPPEMGRRLMESRKNKFSGEAEHDIHERDEAYLLKSYENAKYIAKKFGWSHVCCAEGDSIRTIEDIQREIINTVLKKWD